MFKLFPPFFPQSKFLRNKPWHKLVWLISFIFALCSLYSAFLMLILYCKFTIPISPTILTLPMIIPSAPLLFRIPYGQNPGEHNLSNSHVVHFLPQNHFVDTANFGLLALSVYFIICMFVPSAVYRLFLNYFYGNRWKK